MVVTAVDPELHRERWKVSATGNQHIYCKDQPNRVSDYLLLVFKGVCWL